MIKIRLIKVEGNELKKAEEIMIGLGPTTFIKDERVYLVFKDRIDRIKKEFEKSGIKFEILQN